MKGKIWEEKIGFAKHVDGLFLADEPESGSMYEECPSSYTLVNQVSVPKTDKISSNVDLILLWHRRLGHPNFLYLKKLKPDLFINVNVDCLKCEICLFAKQTRVLYPAKAYKESKPFNLIHSDI